MQWLERPGAPLYPGFELDTQEIPELSENAIAHFANVLILHDRHPNDRSKRNLCLHLKTSAQGRNVFQIRDDMLRSAATVLPLDFNQVRAHQAGLDASLCHIPVYRPTADF